MDEKDLSILYRPSVEIERDYRSDAVILHKPVSNEIPQNVEPGLPQPLEDIIEEERKNRVPDDIEEAIDNAKEAANKLIRIRKIQDVLPDPIKMPVIDVIDTVLPWIAITVPKLEKIKEEDEEKPDEEKYEIRDEASDEGETEPDETDDAWPIMTSSGFIFSVEKNKDIWDMAYQQYLLDSAAMQEEFAEELNNVMEGYVYQLVSTMDEIGLDAPEYLNYDYEGETVTGIPTNYMHLNDIIVQNEGVVKEYGDIFKKTHDGYTTYALLAAYDIANQRRVRYLKERYKDETAANFIEMYDKNYLGDIRKDMEDRYVTARTNVYKMLHSAAQTTKEALDAQLQLAISKCSLLSKDINIFAKKEYENLGYENSTSSKTKDLTGKTDTQPVSETVQSQKKTETSDTINKLDVADLTVGGGIGGAVGSGLKNTIKTVQNRAKDAASGTVQQIKQAGYDALGKALDGLATKIEAASINAEKKKEQKGQGV